VWTGFDCVAAAFQAGVVYSNRRPEGRRYKNLLKSEFSHRL